MPDPPLEVAHLELASGLAIGRFRAPVVVVERGASVAPEVVRKDRDMSSGKGGMHVCVAGDMVPKAVDEDGDGLGCVGKK